MKATFLATATSVALFGLTLPALAADEASPPAAAPPLTATAPAEKTLAETMLQAQLDKCLADGSISAVQVQTMTDEDLLKAIDECSKQAAAAAPPAPAAAAAPAEVDEDPAPAVSRPRVRVSRERRVVSQPDVVFVEREAPAPIIIGGGGGGDNGPIFDQGGGGLDQGGGQGPIINGGIDPQPQPTGLDQRIAGLESGIAEGINTSALTASEAAQLNARLGNIKVLRANLGDSPAARLLIQRQIDRAVTSFNTDVHDNQGIPNPNLFRHSHKNKLAAGGLAGGKMALISKLRARAAAQQAGTAAAGTPQARWRAAYMRARMAKLNGANPTADASKGGWRERYLRARLVRQNAAHKTGATTTANGGWRAAMLRARLARQNAGNATAHKSNGDWRSAYLRSRMARRQAHVKHTAPVTHSQATRSRMTRYQAMHRRMQATKFRAVRQQQVIRHQPAVVRRDTTSNAGARFRARSAFFAKRRVANN